jgi:glycosyltransferase involved in cell wall biosynthesis
MVVRLKEAGCDCSVVCMCEQGHLADDVIAAGVPVTSLGCQKPPGLKGMVRLIGYLRSNRPDIMHSHLVCWAPLAGKLGGVHAVVMTEHGLSLWKGRLRILSDRVVARFTDRIIGVAKAVVDVRRKVWKLPSSKLVFIPNSIDISRFDFEVDPAAVRKEIGLKPTARVIVKVGSLLPVKGHRYLLDAMVEVVDSDPSAVLVLLGDGPIRQDLEIQVHDLGIEEKVKFLGFRQDVERIVKAADVFVISSLREGTSIALLEALAANTPVVATAVGGNPEVIRDGISGLLVPSEDSHSLANAISRILSNPELASEFATEARRTVENDYSAQENLNRLMSLYEELLGKTQ